MLLYYVVQVDDKGGKKYQTGLHKVKGKTQLILQIYMPSF